jgi:ATP/maltotriose-dependent transcriptional regulator MalT
MLPLRKVQCRMTETSSGFSSSQGKILLATKLYIPPARSNWVARPRLLEHLGQGLDHRLILISAPAGFGKTTLVSNIKYQIPNLKMAWVSLDADDNDPVRFWSYAVAALQTLSSPDIGRTALELLRSPQSPPLTEFLALLINDLATWVTACALVLDDYHWIESLTVHDSLNFLLDHLPPQMHVFISTRSDPPLALARWRARGQLLELRADDLRFTPAEADEFLNHSMGLSLSPGDVAALDARAEGWIAGLQMAALSLRGRADVSVFVREFSGSHRYIMDYLVEEVLNRESALVHEFLLHTCVLDRLCGDLCDAVTGRTDSQTMLAHLDRANLFLVPLDDERHWYRYHHLFVDLLRTRLHQAQADQIPTLHTRASEWYEQNGSPDQAIHHALEAQDWERAASLVEQAARAAFFNGQLTTLSRWIETLPEEWVRARPRLRLYQSWAHLTGGQFERAGQMLQEAQQALQALPPSPDDEPLRSEMASLLARNSALAAAMSSGTAQAAQRSLETLARSAGDDAVSRSRALLGLGIAYLYDGEVEKAITTLEEGRSLALATGNMILAANMLHLQGTGELYRGRLRQAARLYQQAADLGPGPHDSSAIHSAAQFPSGIGYLGLADVARERNDLEAAASYLDKGIALCQQGGLALNLPVGYIVQSRLRQAQGDTSGAFESLERAEHVYGAELPPPVVVMLAAQHVRLNLSQGHVEEADRWADRVAHLRGHEKGEARLPTLLHASHQLMLARVYMARDEVEQALALLDEILLQAKAHGWLTLEAAVCQALALSRLPIVGPWDEATWDQAQIPGDRSASLDALRQSLEAARPEGYVRLYLDEGPPMKALLTALLTALQRESSLAPQLQQYVQELVAAFPHVQPLAPAPQPALDEPLSQRELEVLRLICEGHSNQAIADQLVLSLHTVKKHTSNILGKLGVTSRVQAVARARQLGLF